MSKWTPKTEEELADTCLPAQSIVGIRTDLVAAALAEIRRLRAEVEQIRQALNDDTVKLEDI